LARGKTVTYPAGFPRFKEEKERKDETPEQKRGRVNRQKGKRKQALARQVFEDIYEVQVSWSGKKGNEESWDHIKAARIEVKAGAQVGPLATRFLAAEKQSNQAKAIGDTRPFIFVAMPDNMSDGLMVMRLSDFQQLMP